MTSQNWDGVWPTMLTPMLDDGGIDYDSLGHLIDWYLNEGVAGLFAVCQSSEMFFLTLEEKVRLAQFVVRSVNGRAPVIASGHTGETADEQWKEIAAIGATGIDAFVLVSNRLASEGEDDETLISRLADILDKFPEIGFGIYECPYPYKRLLSNEVLRWCANSGRILFLKDTCCDGERLEERLSLVRGTPLRIFNANTTTLLHSLKCGASGYSGVMANFHPDLYVRLTSRWDDPALQAEELQHYLTLASLIERAEYPACAKYYLQQLDVIAGLRTRTGGGRPPDSHTRMIVDQLRQCDLNLRNRMG